jgi:hypothetical protein
MSPSHRVSRLPEQVLADLAACRGTRLTDRAEQRALALLAVGEYSRTVGAPELVVGGG